MTRLTAPRFTPPRRSPGSSPLLPNLPNGYLDKHSHAFRLRAGDQSRSQPGKGAA